MPPQVRLNNYSYEKPAVKILQVLIAASNFMIRGFVFLCSLKIFASIMENKDSFVYQKRSAAKT
ncbi:hypothetical protein, partial [Succinatimonas hippei]|uniref:hypothetical protein n=1 Tax=Succinatimonas hippei TaxID=626938 RepID=UPI001CA317F8